MVDVVGPTPLAVSHQLTLGYTIASLTHHQSFHVNAAAGSGSSGFDLIGAGAYSKDIQDWVDYYSTLFEAFAPTGMAAAGWTLYERVDGSLIPVATGNWSMTPAGPASISCQQMTLVYKTVTNRDMKILYFECGFEAPFHYTDDGSASLGAALHALSLAVRTPSALSVGGYCFQRDGNPPNVFKGLTTTYSRKLRRLRGRL